MTQECGGLALGAAAELVGDDAAFGEVVQRLPQCGGQRELDDRADQILVRDCSRTLHWPSVCVTYIKMLIRIANI